MHNNKTIVNILKVLSGCCMLNFQLVSITFKYTSDIYARPYRKLYLIAVTPQAFWPVEYLQYSTWISDCCLGPKLAQCSWIAGRSWLTWWPPYLPNCRPIKIKVSHKSGAISLFHERRKERESLQKENVAQRHEYMGESSAKLRKAQCLQTLILLLELSKCRLKMQTKCALWQS